ncbi:hypothetical protein YC2023_053531 [Brassica napus]
MMIPRSDRRHEIMRYKDDDRSRTMQGRIRDKSKTRQGHKRRRMEDNSALRRRYGDNGTAFPHWGKTEDLSRCLQTNLGCLRSGWLEKTLCANEVISPSLRYEFEFFFKICSRRRLTSKSSVCRRLTDESSGQTDDLN